MRIFFSPHKMASHDDDDDDVDSEEFVRPNPLVLYVVLLASRLCFSIAFIFTWRRNMSRSNQKLLFHVVSSSFSDEPFLFVGVDLDETLSLLSAFTIFAGHRSKQWVHLSAYEWRYC